MDHSNEKGATDSVAEDHQKIMEEDNDHVDKYFDNPLSNPYKIISATQMESNTTTPWPPSSDISQVSYTKNNSNSVIDETCDMEQSLETLNELSVLGESVTSTTTFPFEPLAQKRRNASDADETPDIKKSPNASLEEKKIVNLRKNIRDVMDENQLDTNTLVAQREESERLARVAEQQKIIREYQRQTAVNRQYVRTQNRVMSLLQSGNTFAKIADLTEDTTISDTALSMGETSDDKSTYDIHIDKVSESSEHLDICDKAIQSPSKFIADKNQQPAGDVVTIEDSSSEDDCILLSDDEGDLEEEIEDDPHNSGLHVKDTYNVPDEIGRVVVNIGHPEGEEDIFIAPQIAKTIKPHQIGGVRFLFDNIIESTKRFKSSSGFGCILAHSMGLGKTLQMVCFCDLFLRHTFSKTVLCVMPINTLQNWVSEFNMWIPRVSADSEQVRPRQFDIFVLNDQQKTLSARAKIVLKWAEQGGVLLIGYELFRLLALKLIPTRKRRNNKNLHSESTGTESNKRLMESIHQALVKPGPDLVICDEGHRIKNAHAGISLALKQIRTRRRIVLTGYPLQNNLLEYWCMVDFVRPNYLGTRTEFCNMFERPIQNGQCIDSTPEDIKLMRYRAHVLHSLLVGFVQRRSHAVLQQTLPQKLEYVILTRMTSFQRQLYETFMNDVVRSKTVPNPLKAFAVCCKIWNHTDVLYNFLKKRETDLDLEIDDAEAVGDLAAPTAAADAILVNSKSEMKENSAINETQHSTLKTESVQSTDNTVDSEVVKINLPNFSKPESFNTKTSSSNSCSENSTINKSYENMYYSENYYQDSNHLPYSNCNGNTYWQEPNAPYFNYQSGPSNIGYVSTPDYVGIVQSTSKSESVASSSEIVDLDTKEIKTVETDIDMHRNPIIKCESLKQKPITPESKGACDSKDSPLNKKAITDTQNPQELKLPGIGSASVIEKECLKLKGDDGIPYEWAIELMRKYEPGLISNSPKMEIFFCILNESIKLGDRVLLFSQSLLTLNLIEKFLQSNRLPESDSFWSRNVSYFRLDGSTSSQEREKLVNEFNTNPNIKLFLISTRAGSLGINLVGANRVIVFDASWNPCHDTQAVYRIYRYGQRKSCYVYRIVMDKCLEKKIYDRQIKKQGMSDRVVDECNPDAHLSMKDVTNLCHDYDDDKNKTDPVSFLQPLESYLDIIIQKIVQQYENSLSKEPFYHESLLIDRKEKKLSQAEKRQAHRGYEMEKKASIKQTLICSTNKIQYRIVRNDGTVVTRPVASIRPMQTTKSQNVIKGTGIRSTRWIPAEVWQRQGMTAQEMTLPLDVVIPTNSNDKSNIILKAGQRVMVLKSAKGIYMQLDSGKIIAIRTSSKTAETNKINKEEVIDITSEGDITPDVKNLSSKQPNLKAIESTYSNTGSKSEIKSQNNDQCKYSIKNSSDQYNCNTGIRLNEYTNVKSPMKLKDNIQHITAPNLNKISQKQEDSNENIDQIKTSTLSNLKECSTLHSSATPNGRIDLKKANVPVIPKKKFSLKSPNSSSDTSRKITGCYSSFNDQSSFVQQSQLETTSENINNKEIRKPSSVFSQHPNVNKQTFNSRTTKIIENDDSSATSNAKIHKPVFSIPEQQEKYVTQSNKMLRMQRPDPSVASVKINNLNPSPYTQQRNNLFVDATTTEVSPLSKKGEQSNSTEGFQTTFTDSSNPINETTSHAGVRTNSTEYLNILSQSPQNDHSHLAEPAQVSQHSLHQQQQHQEHQKLHIYVPHYNMQHTQVNNSASPSQTNVVPSNNMDNSLTTNPYFSSRDVHPYSQYYDNRYNNNNMSTACEHPAQFADYPAYNSYNHPHYHSPFHTNTYGAPSPAIHSNPYHMHWPPLVTPTPISEQCNVPYPSTYSQNGNQSNQWHHQ